MFLGLDLGTTNVKAAIVDPAGRVLCSGSAPVELIYMEDGGVEQDIEQIWRATVSAIGQTDPGLRAAVRAVGVSSQGGALQLLDEQDQPIGRVISWLDRRGQPFDRQITAVLGPDLPRFSGHARSIMAMGQLLRLSQQSPNPLRPPHRIGFVGDIIVGRLCGRRAHDATSLSCAVLYNPTTRLADPLLVQRVGLEPAQLPALLTPRQAAGPLEAHVAAETGLPRGIPVTPAVHDQYASALCLGATFAGDVMLGTGTAWVILAVAERLMHPLPGIGFVCTHLAEGTYGQILSVVNGGSTVDWAMRLARAEGDVDALIESVPPGADGLRCRPLMVEGAGRLDGLRLAHGPAHLLRAVVEGLCLELARMLRRLARSQVRPRRLIMCGGAAGSRVTPRIVADVTAMPVACAAEPATSAIGAGILARGLIEPGMSLAELASRMSPPFRSVLPTDNSPCYQAMLRQYLADCDEECP